MKVTLSWALLGVLFLGYAATAQVRCIATCEYYAASYNKSDSAFLELVELSFDDGSQCSPLIEVAKYRVPVTSSGDTEPEAKAALLKECDDAAAYLENLYKTKTYSPHIFVVHYCG